MYGATSALGFFHFQPSRSCNPFRFTAVYPCTTLGPRQNPKRPAGRHTDLGRSRNHPPVPLIPRVAPISSPSSCCGAIRSASAISRTGKKLLFSPKGSVFTSSLPSAFSEIDWLFAVGAQVLAVEFIGEDLRFLPAFRTSAQERREVPEIFESRAMHRCCHILCLL